MLRNILSVLIGLVIGSLVNMGLITIGPLIIPPPAGVDVSDANSIAASIHLFEAKHFITPGLAHALGTFIGALTAYIVASSHKEKFAFSIGVISLLGGIVATLMIPAPYWFIATDLILAYIPMAWLSIKLGNRILGRQHD